jgi:hypothetical protein
MHTSIVAGSLIAALSLVAPLQAQQVAADVVLRSGPVAGRVIVGDGYSTYRHRVVAYRPAPVRVIAVERMHRRHASQRHDWRNHGYRPVTLYYVDGRYYERAVRGWPGMRAVLVYERDGRYYRECDDDGHRDDRHSSERRDRDWHD